MMTIDLSLVAGRRASLLQRTLESFSSKLFEKIDIANVYTNIDPIFGDETEQQKTEDIIKSFFPDAHISTPEEPGFCKAVKNNWTSTKSDVVFHMEDDWLLNETIDFASIQEVFSKDQSIQQISLNNYHKHWNYKNGPFHRQWHRKKILGFKFKTGEPFPCFTTSPSFLRGDFARRVSALYDVRYDPEKQFYNSANKPLEDFVKPYRNFLYGEGKPFIITDIGREWRDERNLSKTFVNGAAVWNADAK